MCWWNRVSVMKMGNDKRDYIEKCIGYLTQNSGGDALYVKFIKQLLPQIDISSLKKKSDKVLAEIMDCMLEHLKAKPQSVKIRVFNFSHFNVNREQNLTVILALNRDIPYIVRSMLEILRSRGALVSYALYPVLRVQRSTDGNLADIIDSSGVDESLMYIEMSQYSDILDLEKTLNDTYMALSEYYDRGLIAQRKFSELLNDLPETGDFMRWVLDGKLVFLGDPIRRDDSQRPSDVVRMGITSAPGELMFRYLQYIDVVDKKQANVTWRFCGLLRHDVHYEHVKAIPIIREKFEYVRSIISVGPGGHSHRLILNIFQMLPKFLLFSAPTEDLLNDVMEIADAIWSHRPSVLLRSLDRRDGEYAFACISICAPEDNVTVSTSDNMKTIIAEKLGGQIIEECMGMREYSMMRQYFIVRVLADRISDAQSVADMCATLESGLRSWDDVLKDTLVMRVGNRSANNFCARYRFSSAYKEYFNTKEAYNDIICMEKIAIKPGIWVALYRTSNAVNNKQAFNLKIYSNENYVDLSRSLPIIENMSLKALDYHSYRVRTTNSNNSNVWIHHYLVLPVDADEVDLDHIKPVCEDILVRILSGEVENSSLNKLALKAGMNWRSIFLICALTAYLQQVGCKYSESYVRDTMIKYSGISLLLLNLFKAKLSAAYESDRKETVRIIREKLVEQIGLVDSASEDIVLRDLLSIVGDGIVRTNYYQDNGTRAYISFKVKSREVAIIPKPRPFAEIFVYSLNFEGVHLRGDKVSRGGLRWSDRYQDFRTEVLGLMKAQMTKNSIIVPGGAKGGFVIKNMDTTSSVGDQKTAVVERYKTFLSGLLDITDNIVNGQTVLPIDTECLDGNDTYLVVAADKGTATFSDYANEISNKYGFWLGDAFASGGSAGYDHKKMGITARGAWASALNHMKVLKMDVDKPFTVVGIGDMSGDVFGNGLLMSENMKLIAAFNHMHVFIDPNPDPFLSYQERKRLFDLPRSTWNDYDKAILSSGAMVISRKDKGIQLTSEAAQLLSLPSYEPLSIECIIVAILCMPVDMIWNGGIGTYIKSTKETNDKVGDRANDDIRVNGCDVKAKMVVEGGNLGVTQLGRIEYSNAGGKINTDFIDNCGGVHCSDREVNIKIVFSRALAQGRVTVETRNEILREMQDDVARMVLRENDLQVAALSMNEWRCNRYFRSHCRLIDRLEANELLDSALEFLPSSAERMKMAIEGKSLSRPELALVMAYAKIWLKRELVNSVLPDDEFCRKFLFDYFPERMHAEFADDITNHTLRKEIISNVIANNIINRMGPTVISDEMDSVGLGVDSVVRGHIVVREAYSIQWIFDEILGSSKVVNEEIDLFIDVFSQLRSHVIRWVARHNKSCGLTEEIDRYAKYIKILRDSLDDNVLGNLARRRADYYSMLVNYGVPEVVVSKAADFATLAAAGLSMVEIACDMQMDVSTVAKLHFMIDEHLSISNIMDIIMHLPADHHWRRIAAIALFDDVSDVWAAITRSLIERYLRQTNGVIDVAQAFESWKNDGAHAIESYIKGADILFTTDFTDISNVVLLLRHLRNLA